MERVNNTTVDFGRVADRIHIMPDTSVTLQACGGGIGAKTGLYLLPIVYLPDNGGNPACNQGGTMIVEIRRNKDVED